VLTPKDVAEMAQHALKLLENAFSTISADRHQKATRYFNRELATLVKDQGTFPVVDPTSLFRGTAPQCPGEAGNKQPANKN